MNSKNSRGPIHLQSKLADDIPAKKPMHEVLGMIKVVNTEEGIEKFFAEDLYLGRDYDI